MATFEILLALPDDDSSSVEDLVKDMDAAINEVGLFGGNFLIRKTSEDDSEFWNEWNRRIEAGE